MGKNEYMRQWRKKNKDKVKTNAKNCYERHKEEVKVKSMTYYEKNKDKVLERMTKNYNPEHKHNYNREWNMKNSQNTHEEIDRIFGKECYLCKNPIANSRTRRPSLHEIHGNEHPTFRNKKGLEFLKQHKEDFRPLCTQCHTGTHFLMKFGYQWEEIEKLTKEKKR